MSFIIHFVTLTFKKFCSASFLSWTEGESFPALIAELSTCERGAQPSALTPQPRLALLGEGGHPVTRKVAADFQVTTRKHRRFSPREPMLLPIIFCNLNGERF